MQNCDLLCPFYILNQTPMHFVATVVKSSFWVNICRGLVYKSWNIDGANKFQFFFLETIHFNWAIILWTHSFNTTHKLMLKFIQAQTDTLSDVNYTVWSQQTNPWLYCLHKLLHKLNFRFSKAQVYYSLGRKLQNFMDTDIRRAAEQMQGQTYNQCKQQKTSHSWCERQTLVEEDAFIWCRFQDLRTKW